MDKAIPSPNPHLVIFDRVFDFDNNGTKDSILVVFDPSSYPELKTKIALQPKRRRDKETIVDPADYGFTHTAQAYAGMIPDGQPAPSADDLVRVVLKGDIGRPNADKVYDSVVLERLHPQDGGPDWILKTTIDGTTINHGPNKREGSRKIRD